jgi:FlgN protein
MALQAFSDVLFQERRLLELLLFKLDEERLILEAGQTRWLALASREIETVLDELNKVELARSVAFAELATELGLDDTANLATLTAAVPSPWESVFADHHQGMKTLMTEVVEAAQTSQTLLREGYETILQALDATG